MDYLTAVYHMQTLLGIFRGYDVRGSLVTTAWRVLGLRIEETPPPPQVWRVAANIFNKQSRTADRGWPSSLGVGRGG
jgi:hypothetical protein